MNTYQRIALLAFGVAVASSAATVGAFKLFDSNNNISLADSRVLSPEEAAGFATRVNHLPPANTDFTAAADSTISGVVSIKSYATPRMRQQQGDMFSDPFFEYFFGAPSRNQRGQSQQQQPKEQQTGLGSGVIISPDGYIATNNHVIDGAERLEVTLFDNRTFDATVIGADPSTDLALIKIEAENLKVIPMGDSDDLKVGEWVLAVGNPFGFTSTVTTGIISAKARSISSRTRDGRMGIESYIQTDAAVNPGNSGGALVNLDGELVGINTAIYSQTGNYAGYSFAIPVSIVKKVMTDIKQYGTVQKAVLGISYAELTPELIKEKNIKGVSEGIYVGEVIDRSGAMEAGIESGDIITAIDGAAIHNSAQLQEQLARHRPGDKLTITYMRDGKTVNTEVTLLNTQGSTNITTAPSVNDLGATFRKLNADELKEYHLNAGVKVTAVKDGIFSQHGVPVGFVIVDINNSRVSSPEDITTIYNNIMKSDPQYDKVMFITGFLPNGRKGYFAIPLTD